MFASPKALEAAIAELDAELSALLGLMDSEPSPDLAAKIRLLQSCIWKLLKRLRRMKKVEEEDEGGSGINWREFQPPPANFSIAALMGWLRSRGVGYKTQEALMKPTFDRLEKPFPTEAELDEYRPPEATPEPVLEDPEPDTSIDYLFNP